MTDLRAAVKSGCLAESDRFKIVSDLRALFCVGKVSAAELLSFIAGFSGEQRETVWSVVIGALEKVRDILKRTDAERLLNKFVIGVFSDNDISVFLCFPVLNDFFYVCIFFFLQYLCQKIHKRANEPHKQLSRPGASKPDRAAIRGQASRSSARLARAQRGRGHAPASARALRRASGADRPELVPCGRSSGGGTRRRSRIAHGAGARGVAQEPGAQERGSMGSGLLATARTGCRGTRIRPVGARAAAGQLLRVRGRGGGPVRGKRGVGVV